MIIKSELVGTSVFIQNSSSLPQTSGFLYYNYTYILIWHLQSLWLSPMGRKKFWVSLSQQIKNKSLEASVSKYPILYAAAT